MRGFAVGDSLKILPEISARSFDFVLADPPYSEFPLINDVIAEGRRISRGASLYFMYAEDLCHLSAVPDQVLFWTKPVSTKNTSKRYSRFVEVMAVYDIERSPFRQNLHWSVRSGIFTDSLVRKQVHPFEKPKSLIEKLLLTHVPEGGSVLDPFAGRGTVGHVADSLGMTHFSVEIDTKWQYLW
jgi:DNA modification methylase